MNKQTRTYLYFLIFFYLCISLVGCSQSSFILKDGTAINKKEIAAIIHKVETNPMYYTGYNNKNYSVTRKEIEAEHFDKKKIEQIAKLKEGKMEGPFYERDSSIYFLKKIASTYAEKFLYQGILVTQPFGLSDEDFQKELDKMKDDVTSNRLELKELIAKYNTKDGISVGQFMKHKWVHENQLNPEALDWLKNNPKGAIYQSPKDILSHNSRFSSITLLNHKIANSKKILLYKYLHFKIKKKRK